MKNTLLKSFVRRLLTEEVFGAQAFVYHGSYTEPQEMLDILVNDKFDPGQGSGSMYGNGLYTVYDIDPNGPTFRGLYGDYLYKLKVNLHGFIIFDPDICQKVYGKLMSVGEQLDSLGLEGVKEKMELALQRRKMDVVLSLLDEMTESQEVVLSSHEAEKVCDVLAQHVKGIIFTGRKDGKVCVIYDTAGVVPVGWKKYLLSIADSEAGYTRPVDVPFKPFDKKSIKPAISRSAAGDFEPGRFNP